MRILVIEDNDAIRTMLSDYLEEESFAVDAASTGKKGLYLSRINEYDIIMLDYMLPDTDGLEICKEIRNDSNDVPILIISVLAEVQDKVRMLNSGADDYMTKPFSLQEVRARITALLRRPHGVMKSTIVIDHLVIDSARQRVVCGEKEIYLTRKEFTLLEYLARNKGLVVSRGMIIEHVWNMETDPFSNTIEAHIFNLRKKITLENNSLIKTIPGRGYKIIPLVQ